MNDSKEKRSNERCCQDVTVSILMNAYRKAYRMFWKDSDKTLWLFTENCHNEMIPVTDFCPQFLKMLSKLTSKCKFEGLFCFGGGKGGGEEEEEEENTLNEPEM